VWYQNFTAVFLGHSVCNLVKSAAREPGPRPLAAAHPLGQGF